MSGAELFGHYAEGAWGNDGPFRGPEADAQEKAIAEKNRIAKLVAEELAQQHSKTSVKVEEVKYKVQYTGSNGRNTSLFRDAAMARDYFEEKIRDGRKRVTLTKMTKLTLEEKIL
jgi:hypothetical protein